MGAAPALDFPQELGSLARFCDRALLKILQIEDGKYRRLYSREQNLTHYEQLAIDLQQRFGWKHLSQAAFLHGLSGHDAITYLADLLDPATRTTLQGLMQLLALDETDSEVTTQLEQNVLPVIDCRAAFLMVFERLHHVDPDRLLSRWTRRFLREPTPPPTGLPTEPIFKTRLETKQYVASLRSLVVPICRYFKLFHEYHLAENAALWLEAPERFVDIVKFAMEARNRLVPLIDSGAWDLPRLTVRWEWHHVGDMDRNLKDNPPFEANHLPGCGWIAVITEDERDTYLALQELHRRFACRNPRFEGLEGSGTEGQQAILVPVSPGDKLLGDRAVRVRLISRGAYQARRCRDLRALLEKAILAQDPPVETLRTFAPDGRPVDLPRGSVALNFVMAIYKGFVLRVRRAEVNHTEVGLFHPLSQGDVVKLLPDEAILPLPPGWENKVPPETVKSIRKQYREQYNRELVRQGLRWLRARLVEKGLKGLPGGDDFARYVAPRLEALRREGVVEPKFSEHRDISWILRQLGLVSARDEGKKPLFKLLVDDERCASAVDVMYEELKHTRPRYLLDLPEHLGSLDRQICPRCGPSQYEPYVGVVEGDSLVYHLPDAECIEANSEAYEALRSPVLESFRPYILIQTSSRAGMAADVFGLFKEMGIAIDELTGCRLGEGQGVIRVQVETGPRISVPEILRGLHRLEGVNSVQELGPWPHSMESHLPERMEGRERLWTQLVPYRTGPKALEDGYFYGRNYELGELMDSLNRARAAEGAGYSLYIKGPRHIGKSSLLHRFFKILNRRFTRTCATAHYEFLYDEPWGIVRKKLAASLRSSACTTARLSGTEYDPPTDLSLQELIEAIRKDLDFTVVIAVDEVAGLFHKASNGPGESDIVKFDGWATTTPGVLLCWCGLEGPVRTLSPQLEHVLRRAQPVSLSGFGAATTQRMLRAEKLALRHPIEVSEDLARRVTHETAGNPYWVAQVGTHMWAVARGRGGRIVRYTNRDFNRALKRLLRERVPFGERLDYFDKKPRVKEMANTIVTNLSKRLIDGLRGLTSTDLFNLVKKARVLPHLGYGREQLCADLEVLEEIGALIRYVSGGGDLWRVSAPILARYVLTTLPGQSSPPGTAKE